MLSTAQTSQLIADLKSGSFAGLDDAAAATAASQPTYSDFSVAKLAAMIDTRGLRTPLVKAAMNPASQPQFDISVAALGVVNANYETVTMSDPAIAAQVRSVLGGLVATEIFKQDDEDSILSLSQQYPYGGIIAAQDVTAARATMALQDQIRTLNNLVAGNYNKCVDWLNNQQQSGILPTVDQVLSFLGSAPAS